MFFLIVIASEFFVNYKIIFCDKIAKFLNKISAPFIKVGRIIGAFFRRIGQKISGYFKKIFSKKNKNDVNENLNKDSNKEDVDL